MTSLDDPDGRLSVANRNSFLQAFARNTRLRTSFEVVDFSESPSPTVVPPSPFNLNNWLQARNPSGHQSPILPTSDVGDVHHSSNDQDDVASAFDQLFLLAMDHGDGIVRWSPNPDRHDFLSINIGGAGISLYNATGQVVPERFDHSIVAKHIDYPALTTYDWSPTINGLVAVGTKGGDVHLLRVDDSSNSSFILPLKLQRTCQAVAFNTTGLLAVGLDRVRNDQCLQIWDVNQRLTGWDSSKPGLQLSAPRGDIAPLTKLEASVSVTSTRFFEDSPQTLVVGIKNQRITVHDLRDPTSAVLSFTTRNNNNIAIDHSDTNYFASSNLDSPGITVWDRRAGSKTTTSKMYSDVIETENIPWGCALKLDRVINPDKDNNIRSIRYCRDRRGLLGVLSSAGELQVLQTQRIYMDEEDKVEDSPELLEVRRSHTIEFPSFDSDFGRSGHDRIGSFDWIRLGSDKYQPRVITRRFNSSIGVKLVPTGAEESLFNFLDIGTNHQKVDNTAMPMFEDPNETINVYGPLASRLLGRNVTFGTQNTTGNQTNAEVPTDQEPQEEEDSLKAVAETVYKNVSWKHSVLAQNVDNAHNSAPGIDAVPAETSTDPMKLTKYSSSKVRHARHFWKTVDLEVLDNVYGALSTITRARVVDGYLFDCLKNQIIVQDDLWLQDVWNWILGAKEAVANGGMESEKLDLAYMGVCSIWHNDLGVNPHSRLLDNHDQPDDADWASTIAGINKRAGRRHFTGVDTNKPHHRQLCLAICGWGKSADELHQDLEEFERRGMYTKAAVWALCEKEPKRAVEALQRGGSNLMFVALALELQGAGAAPIDKSKWDSIFQEHPQMVEDPYLRAIYALISTGDWKAIANEDSLPLRERVGIALRNFSDHELTSWLSEQLKTAISAGDIEGIVLAGLTDKMMDIMASYVTQFGDVQSAVLIMSYTCPSYFTDVRFNAFRADYRRYLNYHRLHIKRAIFDAESAKLSKLRQAPSTIKPPPRQVTLRCVHCNSGLSSDLKNTDNASQIKAAQDNLNDNDLRNPLIVSGINGGISCPTCGKHLPRCAVCLQTLGLPRSDHQGANTSTQAEDRKADLQKNFLTFCMKCPHVMHADHAEQWFKRHTECPVSECRCQCYVDEARIRKEREGREGFEKRLLERREGKAERLMEKGEPSEEI